MSISKANPLSETMKADASPSKVIRNDADEELEKKKELEDILVGANKEGRFEH